MSGQVRAGEWVEVRSAQEILRTLDERGELGGLPFMPEMLPLIGHRFEVTARADRICDTVTFGRSRRMVDTVFLDDLRCNGSGHAGCQAECRLYWNTAWLRPVTAGMAASSSDPAALDELRALVGRNASHRDADGTVRYRCQATQALAASTELSPADPRPYVRAATSGEVSFGHFLRVIGRAASTELKKKRAGSWQPPLSGPTDKTPKTPLLDLQPGERVRVKPPEQIAQTLTRMGKNRGLWFDVEMMQMAGKEFRVRRRVERLIDELDGHMIELSSDCIMLDGGTCSGEYSVGRWFCRRAIYAYWREAWLERVDPVVARPHEDAGDDRRSA